jgi:thioredoxin 1
MSSFSEIIQSETPVLVDFHATWCGPCKMMAPELDRLKKMMGASLRILKVDIDQNRQTADHYQISGVPTLILFQRGQIKWRQSGVMNASQISQVIQQYTAN